MTKKTDWPADAIVARRERYFAASQRAYVVVRKGQGQCLWDERDKNFIDLAWTEDRCVRALLDH